MSRRDLEEFNHAEKLVEIMRKADNLARPSKRHKSIRSIAEGHAKTARILDHAISILATHQADEGAASACLKSK